MYRGYRINGFNKNEDLRQIGKSLYDKYSDKVVKALSEYLNDSGSLEGTKIANDWFPMVDADIFISHSHMDIDEVMSFAGWLFKEFGIKSFIDSLVWENIKKLQRDIDDKYCFNESTGFYNYDKRNYSTSHVNMILSAALTKMIDKAECIIFFETPASVKVNDTIYKTTSPWIYSEILTTQLISKRKPNRPKMFLETNVPKDFSRDNNLELLHDLDLKHLYFLDIETLNTWKESVKDVEVQEFKKYEALNKLYELTPIVK